MRIVVSIQAKRSSAHGLIYYIARSKVDPEKEPAGREIFNQHSDQLSVEKANDLFNYGISRKRISNEQLHHLVISLKAEEFDRLGNDEKERLKSLKEITRHTMNQFEKEIGADLLSWAAGIHRNTDHPHVHLAIRKEYFDKNLEKKLLSKIPRSLLPHYEKTETKEKIFHEGLLIKSATEKLEEILRQKEQSQNLSRQKSPAEKPQHPRSPDQENNHSQMTGSNTQLKAESEANLNHERDLLARAIRAKYYLDKSKEIISSLESHGDKRRFKIYDEVTKKQRKMSLFDLELRAEKNADQVIKKQKLTDPKAGEELKKKIITEELAKNENSIKRIKTILHNLLRKENQKLREGENEYKTVKPLAEKIRNNYRKENKKLPIPNLTGEELEMLQTHALGNKDFRVAAYLERVRKELSVENATSTRTREEISRLKAKQKLTFLNFKLQEKQLKEFQTRQGTIPVEINGKKRTLQEIELLIGEHRLNEQKFTGKISKVLGKTGLIESPETLKFLNEYRAVINEKLSEKNDFLEKNLEGEKSLQKILNEFYQNDTNPDKDKIEAKFTAAELAEVEALAFNLKLADVYQSNWEDQKRLIETAGSTDRLDAGAFQKTKENLLAGRALAREVICEIEVARAKDELANFKKYRDFQKFGIKDEQTGQERFVSLAEAGLNQKGSILDQTLEYFLENREVRRMRHAVEKQVQEKGVFLTENVTAANNLLQVARDIASDFKTKSFFGTISSYHQPIFTPKELVIIELRITQTTNKSETENLQKILDSIDPSKVKNLPAMLQSFARYTEETGSIDQHLPDQQKSAVELNKMEVKSEAHQSKILETKTESYEHNR